MKLTARDTLSVLASLAIEEEHAHLYCPEKQRTMQHVISDRITLNVCAAYPADIEALVAITATASMRKGHPYRPPVHLAYFCWADGHTVVLTEDGAVRLLEERDLPADVVQRLREQDAHEAALLGSEMSRPDFWDSLNRATPSTAGDGGRPAWTPRRRSAVKLLAPLPRAEAVARMRRFYE